MNLADVEIVPEVRQIIPDLELLIKEKKKIRKRWELNRQAGEKVELNRLANYIHKITRNHENKVFVKEVEDAIRTNNSVWQIKIFKIPNFDTRPSHGATGFKYDAEDVATAIADSLENQFRASEKIT